MKLVLSALVTSFALLASAHADTFRGYQEAPLHALQGKSFRELAGWADTPELALRDDGPIGLTPEDGEEFGRLVASIHQHSVVRRGGRISIDAHDEDDHDVAANLVVEMATAPELSNSTASVSALPVPEFETWGLIALGFGLIGLQLKRSQNRAMHLAA